MRILQVTPFFAPLYGGSSEVPYQISRELVGKGHEVTVYTSDKEFSGAFLESVPGLRVCTFKTLFSWFDFNVTPGIIRELRENIRNFDVVHLHNFRTFQNVFAVHYAWKYSVPYVLNGHGSVESFFQRGALKRVFDLMWGNRILKRASTLVAVSPVEAEQYRAMGVNRERIQTIPNGIDISSFRQLPEKGAFRRKFGLQDSRKIVLYLGRIDAVKGLELLIKAFKRMHRNNNVTLVIAGPDSGYLEKLKSLIRTNGLGKEVLLTGPLYDIGKLEAYVDADVFVLPSFYEIFGITVLEALACGTRVIVTDRCGVADWLKGKEGLSVVAFAEEQLADAMFRVVHGGAYPDKHMKQFIMEQFSWTALADRVGDTYAQILARRESAS